MLQRIGVFDVWVYRRDPDAIRYLLLHTSQEKADRWFNGARFWQIPCEALADGETMTAGIRRCLGEYGLTPASVWAVDHAYTIYNRRFEEIHLILVFAAEVTGEPAIRLTWEWSESRWCTAAECEERLGYRGLLEGLAWTRRLVTETRAPLPELRLA